ncbi:prolyl aminopeptidase [Hyphococcus sp.]|jgi:proline iminopeptidase|uniref:prolyl aminopeptidase n=1 Tax=Hyphococcus sp. TaxID=2038636 RepID=UPI003D14168E
MTSLRTLYPPLEPFDAGMLRVSDLHQVYYEVSGSPDGKPVIVCHGGPGGGSTPSMRRYFDPSRYRVILFDQRGCGKSLPHADLTDNTTWDLVEDMEKLRRHLGVERWQVFGGSWGSTLAMAYAETHPDVVTELVLRGIFTLRREELLWFYQEGASWLFPDLWEGYLEPIPEAERGDLISAYYKRLTGADKAEQMRAAKAWSVWEGGTVSLLPSDERVQAFSGDAFALAFARIECHYFYHGGFFERDDQIIANVDRVRNIPAVIVQGRYDVCTPMKTAWELHQAWPEAEFNLIDDAGHAASEPGIIDALVRTTDRFASI